jgi:ABC-type transport system involved in multi-copper enzyme maturation permease subunit
MFGAMFFERDPIGVGDLAPGLVTWIQVVGGFGAVGLLLWMVFGLTRWRATDLARVPGWQKVAFLTAVIACVICYAAFFVVRLIDFQPSDSSDALGFERPAAQTAAAETSKFEGWALTAGAACAVFAVLLPVLINLPRLRFRRILALAKLSFKEAVRRRVLYVFCFILLLFLFGGWFVTGKPSDQLRTYVQIVFLVMTILLLLTAALLSSFSIPADIKNQTIHTIVTKPVEKFEVVLGRFLGFYGLMTLVLIFMTGVSLLYVLRAINPEAAAESLKARQPLYGDLKFENKKTGTKERAVNVGREWDYRSYITGSQAGQPPDIARWAFTDLPSDLAGRETVRAEFSFDIYRTTKGQENRGVPCTFIFQTWRYQPGNDVKYLKERGRRAGDMALENELAEKYGYFERNSFPLTDFATQEIDLPGGLFKNALQPDEERMKALEARGLPRPPLLEGRVKCESQAQYVGMAKYDFYFRGDEPGKSEKWLFALNFFKASYGLWLRLGLVIALAVTLSTYLSGVISLLVTLSFLLGGLSQDYIRNVALAKAEGGGPLESMVRLARRQVASIKMQDENTTEARIVDASDETARWIFRRLLKVLPDVDRFDLTTYVAEGFNISGEAMGMNFLLLAAYLLPWFILAFYLIRWREIASPT